MVYASYTRLAFSELGLAIGLAGLPIVREALADSVAPLGSSAPRVEELLVRLARHERLARHIVATWRDATNRDNRTWAEHGDINGVMLATSLVPEGVLRLGAAG